MKRGRRSGVEMVMLPSSAKRPKALGSESTDLNDRYHMVFTKPSTIPSEFHPIPSIPLIPLIHQEVMVNR